MGNNKKGCHNNLPLFESCNTTSGSNCTVSKINEGSPKKSNVICFTAAIERKQASLESDALQSILDRAKKLNW
jgi:hypothetical protein